VPGRLRERHWAAGAWDVWRLHSSMEAGGEMTGAHPKSVMLLDQRGQSLWSERKGVSRDGPAVIPDLGTDRR
jgi:hypothetical protein